MPVMSLGSRNRTIGMFKNETNLAKVQAMRIFPQPFHFRRQFISRGIGIRHEPAVQIGKLFEMKGVNAPMVWIGKRMPAPIRQCSQWRGFFKRLRKGLQPGGIHRKTKSPVANRQRIGHVEVCENHVMPRDEGQTVNRRRADRENQRREYACKGKSPSDLNRHGHKLILEPISIVSPILGMVKIQCH
jgi:hypothetical protein